MTDRIAGFPRSLLLALIALAGAVAPRAGHGLSFVMTTDDTLLEQSAIVVTGRIEGIAPHDAANQETRYQLAVDRTLKGRVDGGIVELVLPGGDPSAPLGYVVHGIPRLEAGDRVLVLAGKSGERRFAPVHLSLGLFIEASSRGFRYYVRSIDRHDDAAPGTNREFYLPRAADRFESWIAERVAGGPGKTRYLAIDPAAKAAKFTLIRDGANVPVRWFDFDGGGSVTWTARSDGQAGMNTDEFLQVQQALAAWTNDPGSRISLAYGGVAPDIDTFCDNGTSDGNRVLWNDPLGQIAGSFSCTSGGVLAVAGPCWSGQQQSNGTTYNRAFEARVTVQDGAGCFFDDASGANGAEVLAHEIGHTLGLGHSCGDSESPSCVPGSDLDNALMRATARGNRGAVLGNDDRAAVCFVYPGQPPAVAAPATFSATEDTPLTLGGITIADADSPTITATFSIPPDSGLLSASSAAGVTVEGTTTSRTLSGTPASITSFIASGNLSFLPNSNSTVSVALTIQATDCSVPTSRNATITIAAVNDAPTVSVPLVITGTEDQAMTIVPVSLADVDAGGASVVATFGVPSGTLAATGTALVTVGGTAIARTLTGSVANLNSFLAAGLLTYTAAANANGNTAVTVQVNDQGNTGGGGARFANGTITLEIAPANDAPTVSAVASLQVPAGASVAVSPVSFADLDDPSGNIAVVATFSAPSGTFSASGGVAITGNGTGTITLSGPLSTLNTFLASTPVQYTAANGVSGVVPLTLSLNDQGGIGGAPLSTSRVVNVQVLAPDTTFVNGFEP